MNDSIVTVDQAPQSSVEIETLAKGGVKVTVKIYDVDANAGKARAIRIYRETLAAFEPTIDTNIDAHD